MKSLLLALALSVPLLASANCGNDKPVGNGCVESSSPTIVAGGGGGGGGGGGAGGTALSSSSANSLSLAAGGQGGRGGNAHATGGNATGGNAVVGQSMQGSGNASNAVTLNTTSVSNEARNPVNSSYAPSVYSTVNCAVAVSGGFSIAGFSGSAGSAYRDENCVVLEQVKAVQALGDKETAMEMLCTQPLYNEARLRMGKPCRYVIPPKQDPVLSDRRDY